MLKCRLADPIHDLYDPGHCHHRAELPIRKGSIHDPRQSHVQQVIKNIELVQRAVS